MKIIRWKLLGRRGRRECRRRRGEEVGRVGEREVEGLGEVEGLEE